MSESEQAARIRAEIEAFNRGENWRERADAERSAGLNFP